jgi:Protein of unknown function (DUF1569)
MASAIDTSKVAERRQLHFNSLDDLRADVERLAKSKEVRALGNWSPGQVLEHLAIVMDKSIDGFGHRPPALVRFLVRLLFKRRFLTKPMAPGFKLPAAAAAELVPPATPLEAGLDHIRRGLVRLQTETMRAAHPVLGALSVAEWNQVHCHHAELHLSFLVPVE